METRMIAAALSCLFAAALPGCRHAPAGSADGAAQRFYRAQGPVTDPGKHAGLYANLPRDVRGLCGVVQGAMLHVFWAEKHGVTLAEERKREVNLRTVERMLARIVELDPRPLAERREPSKRLVGNCRDHSVLLCSMLRHAGIPARARCGFATYFTPGRHEDHWVVEHWDSARRRWVRVDPQLDALQVKALGISFDPFDLPPGAFIPAGVAWRRCRAGTLDPDRCGIFDMHGLWFVRGDLVRDVMALNGLELLPWDWNTLMSREREPDADEYRLLDRAAELTARDVPFDELKALYDSETALRMPADWTP